MKVQLKARFHLNGHTIEFHPQAHDLELHTNLLLCKSAAGEVSSTVSGGSSPSDRGGGGGIHPDPEIRGAGLHNFFFRPFGHHFGGKIRGELGPPGPLPWIRHCHRLKSQNYIQNKYYQVKELLKRFRFHGNTTAGQDYNLELLDIQTK